MNKTSKPARFGTMFVHDCQRIALVRDEEGTVSIRLYGDRYLCGVMQLQVFGAPEVSVTTEDDENRLVSERHLQPIKSPSLAE